MNAEIKSAARVQVEAGLSQQEAHLVLRDERDREGWRRYSDVYRLVCLGKLRPSISSIKQKVSSAVSERKAGWTQQLGRVEKV